MNRKLILITMLVGVSLILAGCALFAGAAAGAGTYAWVSGKLTFTTPHDVARSHEATLAAFKRLEIVVVKDETSELGSKMEGKSKTTGETVTVDLEPQASNVTKIDIRVGFFGNHDKEREVADAIRKHL